MTLLNWIVLFIKFDIYIIPFTKYAFYLMDTKTIILKSKNHMGSVQQF